MIQDPSLDAIEFATAPRVVADEFAAGLVAHAVRVKGSGTITVTTAYGSRTLNVNDGELIPIRFTAVTAISGPTAFRIHVTKRNP